MQFNWHCSLVMVTFNICTSCLRIQEGILPERMAQLKGQAGIQTGTGEIRDVSEFLAIFRFTPRAAHWFSACLSLSPNRFPISFIGLLPCQPCCEGLVLLTTEVFKATDLKLPIGFPHTHQQLSASISHGLKYAMRKWQMEQILRYFLIVYKIYFHLVLTGH